MSETTHLEKRVKTEEVTIDNIGELVFTWDVGSTHSNFKLIAQSTHHIVLDTFTNEVLKLFVDETDFQTEYNNQKRLLKIPGIRNYCILYTRVDEKRCILYFEYIPYCKSLDMIEWTGRADEIYKQIKMSARFFILNNIYIEDLHPGNILVQLKPYIQVYFIDFEGVIFKEDKSENWYDCILEYIETKYYLEDYQIKDTSEDEDETESSEDDE